MHKSLIYILLFFTATFIYGQKDSLVVNYDTNSSIELKKFDGETLDRYSNDSNFDYTVQKKELTFIGKWWNWIKRVFLRVLSFLFGSKEAVGILAILLKTIPYIILATVIFLIVRFFIKINTNSLDTNDSENAKVILTEEEDIIKNSNIKVLIEKAIKQNNYRLAVRYSYLLVLQKLEEFEYIEWEQQKTNEDYIKEIKNLELTKSFTEVTHLYDFVWYGNFEINALEYAKVTANFNSLTLALK